MEQGLSVIVLAHNEKDHAVRCIESIRDYADVFPLDVILVDNASDDDLKEWASAQEDITFVYMDEGLQPYGHVLNLILRELSMMPVVLIMSCRYLLTKECLSGMYHLLHQNPQAGAVSCLSDGFMSPLQQISPMEWDSVHPLDDFRIYGLTEDAVMIKASTFDQIGYFDDRLVLLFGVMREFSVRLLQSGIHTYVCGSSFLHAQRMITEEPEDLLIHMPDDDARIESVWGIHYLNVIGYTDMVHMIDQGRDQPISVFEIGCDCGSTLFSIGERYPNAVLHGCDINAAAVRIASFFTDAFVCNVDSDALPFAKESLDYVIAADVLEHLRDPEAVIRRIHPLLKDGGCILGSVPNLMHISVMKQLLHGDFSYTETGLLDRTHIHFFTYNELLRMFGSAGYRIDFIKEREIDLNDGEEALISGLTALDPAGAPFMYRTYQYVFRARKQS